MRVTENVTRQMMLDTLQVTLHEAGWGFERIDAISKRWAEHYNYFSRALRTRSDPEADVAQEHLDRALMDILKGKRDLIPFWARYPEIKSVQYGRKRRS